MRNVFLVRLVKTMSIKWTPRQSSIKWMSQWIMKWDVMLTLITKVFNKEQWRQKNVVAEQIMKKNEGNGEHSAGALFKMMV